VVERWACNRKNLGHIRKISIQKQLKRSSINNFPREFLKIKTIGQTVEINHIAVLSWSELL